MADDKNIVKKTCKELGMTYKELGEAIGYGEPAIKKALANNKVSKPMQKAILLYLEIIELKNQIKDYAVLKDAIKRAIA